MLNLPTESESRMLPIHWAASDGKISSIRFLLDKRQNINAQDGNGCTPVVIATQHNHAACVAFLVKNGADMTLSDSNGEHYLCVHHCYNYLYPSLLGDNALHWAAYKGHVELIGLLSYCLPHLVDIGDTFGQTPLHLSKKSML